MKNYCFLFLLLTSSFVGCKHEVAEEQAVNVVLVGDLHFDIVHQDPHQHRHTRAINRLAGNFYFPNDSARQAPLLDVDAVITVGDMFDKARPDILANYRRHYEKKRKVDDKTINYDLYPGFGNHDLIANKEDTLGTPRHRKFLLNYLDSALMAAQQQGKILNLHPASRSYSFDIGPVHFIQAHTFAGDTLLGESNMDWIVDDLKRYAHNNKPVVYIQHYGVDPWAIKWWPQKERDLLFETLKQYNLAGFFAAHTHSASIQEYVGVPVYQVNNAWEDGSGNGSFAVLQIKGDDVAISSCQWLDDHGNFEPIEPELYQKIR